MWGTQIRGGGAEIPRDPPQFNRCSAFCFSFFRYLLSVDSCVGLNWLSVFLDHTTIQEGWLSPTERESVSAHYGLPGHVPWTIAVNVTWMERGFNAGQMHCSIYPSIFNRLRAIARYWLEIATFSYPLAFNATVGVFPLEFRKKVWTSKTGIMGLPGSEDSLTIG